MSELLEKFSRIKQLPIFPLPVVLLPNELLPLHIFEPRYRKMLKDAQIGGNIFGLSYFNPENSIESRPEIGSIGCIAEIKQAQTLEDGRSNILTVGAIRYRIEGYVPTNEPYLIGEISVFEDYESDPEIVQPLAEEVYEMTEKVISAGQKLVESTLPSPKIATAEPQALSFLVASAVSLSDEDKYEMLVTRSTIERLETMREILKQAIARIEESLNFRAIVKTNGHSKKKIDLDS
jgi:ATP-dependent Lon protease